MTKLRCSFVGLWLAVGALASAAGCVSLKDDEIGAGARPEPDAETSETGRDGGEAPADAPSGDSEAAAPRGVAIASVPDRRPASDFSRVGEVVVDARAALRWEQAAPFIDTFAEAGAHCRDLRLEGASDWRLPSRIELLALADLAQGGDVEASTLPSVFAATGARYWSSSEAPSAGTNRVWSIGYGPLSAIALAVSPASGVYNARCVRGHAMALAELVSSGELVTDRASMLEWERVGGATSMTRAAAQARCGSLTISGKTGFRLPSVKELLSVLDDSRAAPPLAPTVFDGARGGSWMSGTYLYSKPETYFVDFGTAAFVLGNIGDVRCVR